MKDNNYPLLPRIIAHRGNSSEAPENTLAAVRSALALNCDAIEIDLHLSKDNELIVMHDSLVDRTTDGEGAIKEMSLEEIKKLDAGSWKGKAYKGEPVPTFREVLQEVKGKSRLVVELKVEGAEEKVVDALKEADMLDDVVVISFIPKALATLAEIEPDLPRAVLTAVSSYEEYVKVAREAKTKMLDLYAVNLSREVAEKLLDRGYVLWAWTIDEEEHMKKVVDLGVTGITTNRPQKALELFR
ncbi:MAG TPA: glycerophosphodiester phosphodiesterase [Firmicutes bacterium]|jgi:glycerophosphoryl diester phosphodiesterase|nr:glycerophosphodiester phosphodiesterase [Bacillota bacterium]